MARSRSPLDRVFDAVVPRAMGAVDPDELIDRIDLNQLIERLDVDALLGRVDIDALVQRVDVARLIESVDVDALVGRVDVDALVQRIDLPALVARAGIDQIVADATTGLAARTLDVARRQILGVDAIVLALVDRVVRRRPLAAGASASSSASARPRAAGPLARLLGFLIDSLVVSTTFSLGVLLAASLWELFTGGSFDTARNGGGGWAIAFVGWWFAYLWISVGIGGRTVGKGIVGTRVVARDGTDLSPRAAALRALAFPFSFVLGLGFVPALVGRDRRAAHDLVAGSREVVDWGDRTAELPAHLAAWVAARSDEAATA